MLNTEETFPAIVNVTIANIRNEDPQSQLKETNEAVTAMRGGGGPLISGFFVSTSPGDNARRGGRLGRKALGERSGSPLDAPLKRYEFPASFLITI